VRRVGQGIGLAVLLLGFLLGGGSFSRAAAQDGHQNSPVWTTTIHGYPPGTLVGVVYDSESRRGLAGAQVYVEGTGVGTLTDGLGRFTLHAVPSGTLTLGVALIGYQARSAPLVLEEGHALAVTVSLDETRVPLCGLMVCSGPFGCYSYEVVVRDLITGMAPLPEVTLTIRGRAHSDSMALRATSGQDFLHLGVGDGMVYAGPGRDPGPYAIEVSAPGYAPWVEEEVERAECGQFEGNPHPVWLVPVASAGRR